jgi:3-oxoacyl-[acyl-carrier protein] reductase
MSALYLRSKQSFDSTMHNDGPHQEPIGDANNQSDVSGGEFMPVALITGASRGIGAAIALALAQDGYRVVVNHRASAAQADDVVASIGAAGGEAIAIQADVTSADDVAAMVAEVERRWSGIDVLVHNALTPYELSSFADLRWDQLSGKVDSELRAAFLATKAVVPGMRSRGQGRLIYLSTLLSRRPRKGMITLGTAKAALDQFVRYVAEELAPQGITANLVAPTTVEGATSATRLTPEQLQAMAASIPMRRLARPAEVARTVAFLASEASGFTTGHYIPVSGGLE